MLCAEFLSFEAFFEHNSDDFYSYFKQRGKILYLGKYPLILIDPVKVESTERHRGVPTTPYSLTTQADLGVSYFENDYDEIDFEELLEEAPNFDPNDRTEYDTTVSFLILNAVLDDPLPIKKKPKEPIIKSYDNARNLQLN